MKHLSIILLSLLALTYTLLAAPRDIGHTDSGYGYWDPTSLPVVYVTSLADSGTGTYREAVDGQSNVWVKFKVEGVIETKSRVTGGSNVFIDGSDAPGVGVTIKNDDLVFDTQDQIWIQDITFRAGDYLLPMPDRIRDFEDQGGGVWRSSNRFWARLTDDAHIQDTVGDGAVNPGVMFSSTGDTEDLVELTRAASEGAVGAGEFYLDASDDELFINTGNGDGSDVNTGLLIVRPIKAQHPDCLSISNSTNIVITHCTFLEGTDITYQSDNNRYQTFRANIVGRGVGYRYHIEQTTANLLKGAWSRGIHGKGALFKMDSGETNRNLDTLIDRNLWIDIYDRSPRCASGGEYLITNNYGVGVDGMDVQLTNDTFGDGQVSLIGNYWDTESATDYTEVFGVPYLRIDDNGSVYMADGTPDEANFWGGSLQNSDPIGTEASPADFSNNAGGDIPVGSLLSSAHDTVTGQTILSAADAKTWVTRNAGPRPDRNRPAIVNELLTRAANPPASFYWPVNNGIVPFDGYDPDAEYYFRRAKALDPVAFDLSSIDGSYTTSANKAAINTLIERLKDAGVWTDTAEWLNLAGVSYDAIAAKLKRDTSETITYQSLFASGTDSFAARLGTAAGNIDSVGGENDTLRFTTSSTTTGLHLYRSSFLTAGRHYKIRFSFYYPSSNSDIDGVQIRSNSTTMAGATWSSRAADTWHELSANIIWPATGELRFYALEGGSFAGDAGADDLFYLKDIIVRAVSPSEFILNNFTSSEYLAAGSGAGLTGDGSTMYIDSGYWFPNLSGNDLSLSAWVNGSPASSSALIGSTNSTTAVMSIQDNTTNLLYNGPDSDAAITGSASTTGLLTLSRRSTTDIAGLLNGVSDGTDSSSASVSSSDYAANVGLFARLDDVAGAENYTDGTLAAAAYGSGWTTAQTLAAYKALRDYLRTIGAN